MKIFLSVGHSVLKNGSTTSADGTKNGGINEYYYCKELGGIVANYLRKAGHVVDLVICPEKTFTNGNTEEMNYKLAIENNGSYDLSCELHLNCFNGTAHGSEVYYYSTNNTGKMYAQRVANKLGTVFTNRGAKGNTSFYMIRRTKATAILIESFFCDNVSDCKIGANKDKIGRLIAEGIHGGAIASSSESSDKVQNGKLYKVQVGAFSVKSNAEKLKKELEEKGYKPFIQEV